MAPEVIGRFIDAAVAAIREHAAHLTELDRAIAVLKAAFDPTAAI